MANNQYSFKSPRRQLFPFPQDVISSMLDNPSSHIGLMKLYQTCKYFWFKRQILIADDVGFEPTETEYFKPISFGIVIAEKDVSHSHALIWLTNSVRFACITDQQLLHKIYRSSAQKLLFFYCSLQFEDFVRLVSENNVTHFDVEVGSSHFYHSDKSKATIDEILQHLPNVQHFCYIIDQSCSLEVLTKMNDIRFNHKFKYLKLDIHYLHPTFDMNLFCEFIIKNSTEDTELSLVFEKFSGWWTPKEELKLALTKLDSKWKTEAAARNGLKRFFLKIDPNWME